MKYFSPFALALLLTACAVTPEDKEAAHQRQLAKEARENFIAMKAQEHPDRPVVLHDEAPSAHPKAKPNARFPQRTAAAARARSRPCPDPRSCSCSPSNGPCNSRAKAILRRPIHTRTSAAAQPAAARRRYGFLLAGAAPRAAHDSTRQQAAEAKYARALAKRPEDLSPEERLYAHEHF